MSEDIIQVTKTRLPHKEDFFKHIDGIFQSLWLTNNGHCVQELEKVLKQYLNVEYLLSCNNGTMAIMIALQAAGVAGKKIALPPYTYVATLSALLWMGCTPVFVDIDPASLCLSPEKLLEALKQDPEIAAVMPVHIYGLACDVDALENISKEYQIPIIYDAAQAFGSSLNKRSLLDYGDYATCSFHATKLFHTAEGGCIISHSEATHRALSLARAFGHIQDDHYCLGINGKMSELHAAMGLSLLDGTAEEIAQRKRLTKLYNELLESLPLQRPVPIANLDWNNAYYPILFPDENTLIEAKKLMTKQQIYPRRYFYPSLNTLSWLQLAWRNECPVAESAANRVLCLPMFGDISMASVQTVVNCVKEAMS